MTAFGKRRLASICAALLGGTLVTAAVSGAGESAFKKRIRDGVIRSGDRNYDEKTRLIVSTGRYPGRIHVAQSSPEYAAALLDAGKRVNRANAVIAALLDHQWLKDKDTHWYGNFIWWHGQKRPKDANAVAFMTPWLCYYVLEHEEKLTEANRKRLRKALPLCLTAVRKHRGPVHYDNIWLLKIASRVTLGLAMKQPKLIAEAETRLDEWIRYVSRNGINEFNSPTYAAVNVYALEFVWRYAPESATSLRKKTRQLLDFCYADVFQNWHWEAEVGAGAHSRAYPRDRLTGKSLVEFLIRRHCGGELRAAIRPFEYNFVFSDYSPPDFVRAMARKAGRTPMTLHCSHPGWTREIRVDRSLYVIPEVTLGTQTGYRANADQALPFKITYAGSKAEERASFITPVPAHNPESRTRGSIAFAHHQEGPRAIVLYEADIKGRKQSAYLRLVIDPSESGKMVEEIAVDGKPYDGKRRELKPGAVVAWRAGKAAVAVRLLEGLGVDAANPGKLVPKSYVLSPTKGVGLCLHCLVCYRPRKKVAVNNLSCGFLVRVAAKKDVGSLAKLSAEAAAWKVDEKRDGATRGISWEDGAAKLRLRWKGDGNRVTVRETNGKKLGRFPLYESPLINLERGGGVRVSKRPATGRGQ
jgi:hypothetical protein